MYLEAEQTRRGAAADRGSRYYNWEVRLTPGRGGAGGRRATARSGASGTSCRSASASRAASWSWASWGPTGELDLKGLQVRWGLGLRENLFVVNRETGRRGEVERFVFTGKGWGHGVGLCQVGAYGMAQAGSTYEEILKHYYTGSPSDRARRGGGPDRRPSLTPAGPPP